MTTTPVDQDYAGFIARLKASERFEAPPRSRGREKLAGMLRLLERLGHPERRFLVVHIAGTTGKGMTAAMVARIIGQTGAKVGIYVSPHLTDIRERIVLQGRPIGERAFQEAGSRVLDTAEQMGPEPYLSYFDLLTAIGMTAIAGAGVEWAVLEAGLGGFSDATNTTDKALAIITPIGLDHMAVLGDNVRDIAEQKLGIVRSGIPTCLAPQDAELMGWMERRITELGGQPVAVEPLALEEVAETPGNFRIWPPGDPCAAVEIAERSAPPPRLGCAATALAAARLLLGPAQGTELAGRLSTALHTSVPGRLDFREALAIKNHSGAPFVSAVLDGGHNLPALHALVAQLQTWGIGGYTLIFGMQRDKLLPLLHEPLARLFAGAGRIITMAPNTPRSPSTTELHGYIEGVIKGGAIKNIVRTLPGEPFLLARGGPREALLAAAQWPGQPLVVAGSFWMRGDIMAQLRLPGIESEA